MKNNLEYYRHKVVSHNHWKFEALRLFYQKTFGVDGWAGEGKFWALNNMIAESEYCMLRVTREKDIVTRDILPVEGDDRKITVATKLGFTLEEFDQFLDILIDRCKLLKIKDNHLISEETQEVLSDVQESRRDARERQKKRRLKLEQEQKTHSSRVTKDVSHQTTLNVTGDQHTEYSKEYNTLRDSKLSLAGGNPKPVDKEEKKQPKKKQGAPPPKPSSSFTRMKNCYYSWFRDTLPEKEKRDPKFNGGEASRLKEIEVYLRGIHRDENLSHEEIENRIVYDFNDTLLAIPSLGDRFLQKLRDIKVIASKFNDIFSAINNKNNGTANAHQQNLNGYKQRTTKSTGAENLVEDLRQATGGDFTIRG